MAENIYWWKLNLAEKHKMAYDNPFQSKKWYNFFANNYDKILDNHTSETNEMSMKRNIKNQKVTCHRQ